MSIEMKDYTHAVIIMQDHYPSVFLFESETEAKKNYDSLKVENDECDDTAFLLVDIRESKGRFWCDRVDWY